MVIYGKLPVNMM